MRGKMNCEMRSEKKFSPSARSGGGLSLTWRVVGGGGVRQTGEPTAHTSNPPKKTQKISSPKIEGGGGGGPSAEQSFFSLTNSSNVRYTSVWDATSHVRNGPSKAPGIEQGRGQGRFGPHPGSVLRCTAPPMSHSAGLHYPIKKKSPNLNRAAGSVPCPALGSLDVDGRPTNHIPLRCMATSF